MWKPENPNTDLEILASRENLDQLKNLTMCDTRLDDHALAVIITGTDNDAVLSVMDRLKILEHVYVGTARSLFWYSRVLLTGS